MLVSISDGFHWPLSPELCDHYVILFAFKFDFIFLHFVVNFLSQEKKDPTLFANNVQAVMARY